MDVRREPPQGMLGWEFEIRLSRFERVSLCQRCVIWFAPAADRRLKSHLTGVFSGDFVLCLSTRCQASDAGPGIAGDGRPRGTARPPRPWFDERRVGLVPLVRWTPSARTSSRGCNWTFVESHPNGRSVRNSKYDDRGLNVSPCANAASYGLHPQRTGGLKATLLASSPATHCCASRRGVLLVALLRLTAPPHCPASLPCLTAPAHYAASLLCLTAGARPGASPGWLWFRLCGWSAAIATVRTARSPWRPTGSAGCHRGT